MAPTRASRGGGTGAFTIEVTEDMCAQIAACSGRLSKQRPVYIWDATSDDWARAARTAADIGTDFIPGVTHAKTAYDAYQQIQNGEDPVDVLMAAGGDAALGLIPGLRAGKKLDKALDKAEDVADATGDLGQATKRGADGRKAWTATNDGKVCRQVPTSMRYRRLLRMFDGRRGCRFIARIRTEVIPALMHMGQSREPDGGLISRSTAQCDKLMKVSSQGI